jgi:hypothetical protein
MVEEGSQLVGCLDWQLVRHKVAVDKDCEVAVDTALVERHMAAAEHTDLEDVASVQDGEELVEDAVHIPEEDSLGAAEGADILLAPVIRNHMAAVGEDMGAVGRSRAARSPVVEEDMTWQ